MALWRTLGLTDAAQIAFRGAQFPPEQEYAVGDWIWCPPCRREIPLPERLNQRLQSHGLAVLAVDVGEDSDTVFSFSGQLEPAPNFPILLDCDSLAMQHWKVKGLPATFVVDRAGRVIFRAVGASSTARP